MVKNKKLRFAALFALIAAALLLTACADHEHVYEYEHDAAEHWQTCSVCREATEKSAHAFGEWETVTPATCTAAGSKKQACTCGYEKTEEIAMLAHTYEAKHDATNHWQECSVCNDKIEQAAHAFGEWETVTPATCTAAGSKKRACECGSEETAEIAKLDHNYQAKHDETNHWQECSVCQDVKEQAAHAFGEWETVTPATCTAAGSKKRACECGSEETAEIAKLDHNYQAKHDATNHWQECSVCQDIKDQTAHAFGDWTITKPATCTEAGSEKRVCSVCQAEDARDIAKLDHNYQAKHDATNHWQECSVCQDVKEQAAHAFGEWETVTPATCTAAGSEKRVCSVCQAEDARDIAKLDHNYEAKHDATNHWQECSVCQDVKDQTAHAFVYAKDAAGHSAQCSGCEKTVEKVSHTFVDGNCSVCGWEETQGLAFRAAKESYSVSGLGSAAGEKISIPATHEGKPVTEIATSAFSGKTALTGVSIPSSVTKIGNYAFYNCAALSSVEGCAGVTEIGTYGFNSCKVLANFTLPSGLRIVGDNAFSYCPIASVVFPSSLETVGASAFSDCAKIERVEILDLKAYCGVSFGNAQGNPMSRVEQNKIFLNGAAIASLTIPDGVAEIKNYAFVGLNLTGLTIPAGVTAIGEGAFYGCRGLTTVTIPDGVFTIGKQAFYGNTELSAVSIPDSVKSIGENAFMKTGIFANAAAGDIVYADKWAVGLNTQAPASVMGIAVKEGTVGIGYAAFRYSPTTHFSNATSVSLPASLRHIGTYAFAGFSALREITLPEGLVDFDTYAFSGCSDLAKITIPKSVTSIGNYAFNGCSALTEATFEGAVEIGANAFNGCKGLAKVVFDVDGIKIGEYAFNGCENIAEASFLASVEIGSRAFANCKGLEKITFDGGRIEIEEYAFYGCPKLNDVRFVRGVVRIGANAFTISSSAEARYLTNLYLSDLSEWSAIEFEDANANPLGKAIHVFIGGTENLEPILPEGLKRIRGNAFAGAPFVSVTIPESVETIEGDAFGDCGGMTIYAKAASKPTGWIDDIWKGEWNPDKCPVVWNSDRNSVAEDGRRYVVADGIRYGILNGEAAIAAQPSVKTAFTAPSEITVDGTAYPVTSVADSAFSGNKTIVSAAFPDSVKTIGKNAFYSAGSLAQIDLGKGVETIGAYAFYDCPKIVGVKIPASVKKIGSGAFSRCFKLTEVAIEDVGAWCGIAFDGYLANPLYQAKRVFQNGAEVTELVVPDGVTSIGKYAFYNATAITKIEIPSSVTSIGESAFYGAKALKTIVYKGTQEQWNAIGKVVGWDASAGSYTVVCDGAALPE